MNYQKLFLKNAIKNHTQKNTKNFVFPPLFLMSYFQQNIFPYKYLASVLWITFSLCAVSPLVEDVLVQQYVCLSAFSCVYSHCLLLNVCKNFLFWILDLSISPKQKSYNKKKRQMGINKVFS